MKIAEKGQKGPSYQIGGNKTCKIRNTYFKKTL